MHKEIIINSTPNEARVALLEDHDVVEFMMERADHKRAVGNVYKGVVTAVRPGLQAAFVDIGMEKGGFLHVSDLIHDDPVDDDDGRRGRGRGRGRRREGMRPIETMLKEGDEILVQVTKEVIGTKGPRLTADISLPGRFMVLMPKGDHVGVSRKIEDRKERGRLKGILSDLKPDDEAGAFIIRTAAIGQDAKMIERDMQYLRDLWKEINQRAHTSQAPAVVHEDVGLIVSLIRDIFKNDVDSVVVDSKEDHTRLMQYVKTFSPDLRERITLYNGEVPIFDKYGVEAELKKSLDKKVWMKRGGFLVIEQTEALVAIDVNTGRFIGKKNQAETIFKTNMVAAKEIARQLRLRDVGGIIVLDFIDMDAEEDKRRVLAELRQHLKRDRSRTKTFAVSDLGLIEMSRQRVQESLKDRLSDNCPYCSGSGQVLSVDTLSNKVERLLAKLAATRNEKAVQVRANPTLALQIMTERANTIQQIERQTGIKIDVVDDARLHREEFQIVSLSRRKDLVSEIEKSDEKRGGGGDARRRGDDDRQRGGRDQDRDARSGDDERPRRRRRRDEGGEEAPAERGGRRSRRRRDEGDSTPERETRSRRERGDEAEGEDRSRRRRRSPRSGDESPRREDARNESSEVAAAADTTGHPAATEGDEEKPRRRRRRGRRGGRGRRRGRNEEGGESNSTESSNQDGREAREGQERDSRSPRGTAASDDRQESDGESRRRSRRRDEPAEDRNEVKDSPRAAEAPAAPTEAAGTGAGADESGDSDARTQRRRRRRRRTSGSSSAAPRRDTPADSDSPAEVKAARPADPEPAHDEVETRKTAEADERVEAEPTRPAADARGSDGDDDSEGGERQGRRRRRRGARGRGSEGGSDDARTDARSRPEASSRATDEADEADEAPRQAAASKSPGNGVGGPIDTPETYVRPVPEGSSLPTEERIEEARRAEPGPVETDEESSGTSNDDGQGAGDRRMKRRRRRKRTAGTPTRLIGTGRQKDKD